MSNHTSLLACCLVLSFIGCSACDTSQAPSRSPSELVYRVGDPDYPDHVLRSQSTPDANQSSATARPSNPRIDMRGDATAARHDTAPSYRTAAHSGSRGMRGDEPSDFPSSVQSTSTSFASPHDNAPTSRGVMPLSAATFIAQAASAGMWEVQSSELALTKLPADSPSARFARQMIADHSKANVELAQVGRQVNEMPPQQMLPSDQKSLDELRSLTGDAFARRYDQLQLQAHKNAVELFRRASALDDPQLRAFAARTLPTLEMHLAHAGSLPQ